MKQIRYLLEAALVGFFFALFRMLPVRYSSWLGGVIAQYVGRFLPAHHVAIQNIARVFPEKSAVEQQKILSLMWDNLGRTAAELSSIPGDRLTSRLSVFGLEHLQKPSDKPVIYVGGHFANWELIYTMIYDRGIPISLIYRHINNPYIDRMVAAFRKSHSTQQFRKGPKGATQMVRTIKSGESLAMLIDQKLNTGISIPFFGHPAMTASAVAEFALKFDLKIIPVRIIRKENARFEGHLYPPLAYEKSNDHEANVRAILVAINHMLEDWIRENPQQWFWVHRRWPKEIAGTA